MNKIITILSLSLGILSCNRTESNDGFSMLIHMEDSLRNIHIKSNQLGYVEGISCNDSLLVALDYFNEKSFSLFNYNKGNQLSRFGQIGKGHDEISLGCIGNIVGNQFVVLDDVTKSIVLYNVEQIGKEKQTPMKLNLNIKETMLTSVSPYKEGKFMGMGVSNGEYKYVLFDKGNKVLDKSIRIWNADDKNYNNDQKFLSNQGKIIKHPKEAKYVGQTFFLNGLDFLTIDENKILCTKSLNEGTPVYNTIYSNGASQVVPTSECINGYIDICGNEEYVFALYSDKRVSESMYCANCIKVFDWDGKKIKKITFDNNIYYIAASSNRIYTVELDETDNFVIAFYPII